MKLTGLLKKGGLALGALGLISSGSAYALAPDSVSIRSINYAGSGCPAGSVAEDISPDYQAFTLMFDSYIAEAGPGVSFREGRKNCNINLSLDFPQGWSFAIMDVDYRGYVYLDRNVTGSQTSRYHFQGDRRTATLQSTYRGPIDQDYHIRDTLGLQSVVWSPCGASRSLNINTAISLNNRRNRNGGGLMTTDTIDGQLTHVYNIKWRRCW